MPKVNARFSLGSVKHIHIVGVAGIGMSAIAEFLIRCGFSITGSDSVSNDLTERLQLLGARIFEGHSKEHLSLAPDLVVHTSAVKAAENPETQQALALGIPVIKRYDILKAILRSFVSIGVAGTHGKTTTTAMLSLIFEAAGLDPTALVGGQISNFNNGNLRYGKGPHFIIESDEYDRTFLRLDLEHTIITNIEADHLDIYKNGEAFTQAFRNYVSQLPFYSNIVVNIDNAGVRDVIEQSGRSVVTCSLKQQADYSATDIYFKEGKSHFGIRHQDHALASITLNVPGNHNIMNALCAAAMAHQFDIPAQAIERGLASFRGVKRRFEVLLEQDERMVIDDYAHHPTEIEATLQAAQQRIRSKPLVAIFQPHLYSRTADFKKEFALALSDADEVILAPLYPAREQALENISSHSIKEEMDEHLASKTRVFDDFEALKLHMLSLDKRGSFLFMGAGSITKYAHWFAQELGSEEVYG